jgi:hypothetical protein
VPTTALHCSTSRWARREARAFAHPTNIARLACPESREIRHSTGVFDLR